MDARFQPDDRIFALQLDRGAIVRRKDVVWGARGERAHAHTFCLTNILPQVQEPGGQGWGDLEDHILAAAAPADGKLSIFAGPFFSADDPSYDDLRRQSPGQRFQRTAMRIPLITWLIAVWVGGGQIKAAGFLRDQREGLERTGPLELSFGGAVLKQTLIGRIEERTGLAFGGLAQRDTFLNQGFEERTLSRASDMII
jgi:endonuclease G